MSYKALYRKWRPGSFADVYGQDQVTSILKYQVANQRHSHAYLFCGSRGTGKTSCAKILSKALNCLSPENGEPCGKCAACLAIDEGRAIDVVEMDAASNNSVDDIREIIDNVVYSPAELKYRVYIIDEVHMLSTSAFNALLKTLEEPPSYIVFILATTELNRIPATIVSRCQRFDFLRIPTELLATRIKAIAAAEGAEITDDGALLIARLANGGFRDAISLLEMCIGKHVLVDEALVSDTLGLCGSEVICELVTAVAKRDIPAIFRIMTEAEKSSKDISVFWQDLMEWYRNMLVITTVDSAERYLTATKSEMEMLQKTAGMFDMARLLYHCRLLDSALGLMRKSTASKRNIAELTLIRMSDLSLSDDTDALLARIVELENKLLRISAGGTVQVSSAVEASEQNTATIVDASLPIEQAFEDVPPPPDDFDAPDGNAPVEASPKADTPKAEEFEAPPWWEEVVEKFSSSNPSAAGFLRGTQIISVGSGYEIITRARTAKMMLSRPANLSEIADFITALSGNKVTVDMINITVAAASSVSRPGDELFDRR